MALLSIEHSPAAYKADFVLYALAVAVLAVWLGLEVPPESALEAALALLAGLLGWTLVEYLLHRFVLHGVPPFRQWHAEHHARPLALIFAPTLLSGGLIAGLVYLPALEFGNEWIAGALTLGLLAGYLGYAVTHHALHHRSTGGAWLRRRRRWHTRHHRHGDAAGCYGVTTSIWDDVFGSTLPSGRPRA